MSRWIAFALLVLLVGGASAQFQPGPDPRSRPRSPTQARATPFIVIVEVERLFKANMPEAVLSQIAKVEERLLSATSDEERTQLRNNLSRLEARRDRSADWYVLGRHTYWYTPSAPKKKWTYSQMTFYTAVPRYDEGEGLLPRRDDMVVVRLGRRRYTLAKELSPGDFIQFANPNHLFDVGESLPFVPLFSSPRHGREGPDWSGFTLYDALGRARKIARPETWPSAPVDWDPLWSRMDKSLNKAPNITVTPQGHGYSQKSRSYLHRYEVTNHGDKELYIVSLRLQYFDVHGNVIGKSKIRHATRVKTGESRTIEVSLNAQQHKALSSAEYSVERFQRGQEIFDRKNPPP